MIEAVQETRSDQEAKSKLRDKISHTQVLIVFNLRILASILPDFAC